MCESIARRGLISLNSMAASCGLAAIVGGIVMNVQMFAIFQNMPNDMMSMIAPANSSVKSSVETVTDLLRTAPYLLIALGCFVFLVSVSGCLGAKWRKMWLLKTYKVVLFLLLLGLATVAALVYIKQDAIRGLLEGIIRRLFDGYTRISSGEILDVLQVNFQCCGVNSSKDWDNFSAWQDLVVERASEEETTLGDNSVPDSCCVRKRLGCGWAHTNNDTMSKIYHDGCSEVIWTALVSNEKWVALGALVLATLLIVSILLSCSLIAFADKPSETNYKK